MIRAILRAAVAALLSATLVQGHANETVNVDLPHVEPIELTYRAFDPQHVLIDERILLEGIARSLSAKTRWPLRTGQRDTADAVLDTGGRTRLAVGQHLLAIEYLALTRYLSGGATGTTMTVPVSYSVERTPDLVKITLTFPDQAKSVRDGLPFITRKLWNTTDILSDYARLSESLKTIELHLQAEAHGELESPYKPDAVLGNLERLLGRPVTSTLPASQIGAGGIVTRDGVYIYTVRGERRQVKVSTYPYHDGTKLGYTASLPYTLRSDGSSTGDDDGAQLRDLLQKVISD